MGGRRDAVSKEYVVRVRIRTKVSGKEGVPFHTQYITADSDEEAIKRADKIIRECVSARVDRLETIHTKLELSKSAEVGTHAE